MSTKLSSLLRSVIDRAAPIAAQSSSQPNRIYVGTYHKLPPGARKHVGRDGKPYYVPQEGHTQQPAEASPRITPAEQSEHEERTAKAIQALREQLKRHTDEAKQAVEQANEQPADPARLRELNEQIGAIEEQLQELEAEQSGGEQH